MDALLYKLKVMTEYTLLEQLMCRVDGFLEPREGYLLYLLARHGWGLGEIVEIGSYKGRSTCWLALGSSLGGREKVTAIDTFAGSPEHLAGGACQSQTIVEEGTTFNAFMDNVRTMDLVSYVEPIVATSREAAKTWHKPIRLLFIDGDHDYESCAEDFRLWSPFVIPRGCIAFHDYGLWAGVTKFCNELMASDAGYREVAMMASVRVILRDTKAAGA